MDCLYIWTRCVLVIAKNPITFFSSPDSTMDRFNLNNYRQRNPQPSAAGTSRSGSSALHTEAYPVASTSKLPPLQNGQPMPPAPFQQQPSGKNRAEPPQIRISSSHHASTLSHQQFDDSHTQKASTSALQQQVRVFFFYFQYLINIFNWFFE